MFLDKLNLQDNQLDEEALETLYSMADRYCLENKKSEALKLFQLIAKNDISFGDVIQKIDLLSSDN